MLGLTRCLYSRYRTGTLTIRPHLGTLGRGDSAEASEDAPKGAGISVVDNPVGAVTTSEGQLLCGTTVTMELQACSTYFTCGTTGLFPRVSSVSTTVFSTMYFASKTPGICRRAHSGLRTALCAQGYIL